MGMVGGCRGHSEQTSLKTVAGGGVDAGRAEEAMRSHWDWVQER